MLLSSLTKTLHSLSICILCTPYLFERTLSSYLEETAAAETTARYTYRHFSSAKDLLDHIRQVGHVDCLLLQATPELQDLLDQLRQQIIFFPAVIIVESSRLDADSPDADADGPDRDSDQDSDQDSGRDSASARREPVPLSYHPAVITVSGHQLNQVGLAIDQAISKFLQLQPNGQMNAEATPSTEPVLTHHLTHNLMAQQLQLAEKLKERLDYLGVYYKRNSQHFLRHMSPPQRAELLQQLTSDYREIILTYFSDETHLNDKIDNFVNFVFFADVPISKIVEIHMELMDEFSKQLKLEGRSDEILLDYRLTLIDILAHLCEMYRRSIPRES